MASKLKCPLCGHYAKDDGLNNTWRCSNQYCDSYEENSSKPYNALMNAIRDLEIARKALEKLNCEYNRCRDDEFEGWNVDWEWWAMSAKNVAENALEQIEHKES